MTEQDQRLMDVVDMLPLAIGLIDGSGKIVACYGALRWLYAETIPSRDPGQRWQVFDYDFKSVGSGEWPSERALRGETPTSANPARFTSADGNVTWVRATALPVTGSCDIRVVSLLEEITHERRAIRKQRDDLEERFAEILVSATRSPEFASTELTLDTARSLIRRHMDVPLASDPPAESGLTPRETEVLKLLVFGEKHKHIAGQLGITVKTVEAHRTKAANKLGLHTRADILRYALRNGWLIND